MMTLENAIKTLDDVIPPHTHNTADREHMPIVLAWEAVKVELENREPVVHCKDCRLGDPDLSLKGSEQEVFCNYYDHPKSADGFCEKGKMRTYE